MNVKALVIASMWLAWCAAPICAAERYGFRVAEGTQALAGETLPPEMAQLAGKPMMVLIAIDGTHWRWMLNGCAAMNSCEWRIDERGGYGGRPDEDAATLSSAADVGLTRIDATRFRLRCLRETCVIRHRGIGATRIRTALLHRGSSIELPVENAIDVELTNEVKR
jgi:hypothetical protein